MKLSIIPLALLASATENCQAAEFSPLVSCCEQRGGFYQMISGNLVAGESGICTYNGENFQASFFYDTYCSGENNNAPIQQVVYTECVQPNQEGFQVTCLSCCVTNLNDFATRCGTDEFCHDSNADAFGPCGDACARQCVGYCYETDTECIDQCEETVGDAGLRQDCVATCTAQYEECNRRCADERAAGAGGVAP